MTEEYVPDEQPFESRGMIENVGVVLTNLSYLEPDQVMAYDRDPWSTQQREDMLVNWGHVPPDVRAWTYYTIELTRAGGNEFLSDVELILAAFAPKDDGAWSAAQDDPQMPQYFYNQEVRSRGDAAAKGRVLMGELDMEGEAHWERVVADTTGGFAKYFSPIIDFANDHGGGMNVNPRSRLAAGRNLIDGTTYQDMGRIPTFHDGFDEFNDKLDSTRKAFAAIVGVAFTVKYAIATAPVLLQRGGEFATRFGATPTGQSLMRFGQYSNNTFRQAMPQVLQNHAGMNALRYASYRTGIPIDQLAMRAAQSDHFFIRMSTTRTGRAALAATGLIVGTLTADTLNQVFNGAKFDEIQEEQAEINEERERLELEDEKAKIEEEGTSLGELFDASIAQDIALPLSESEDKATEGFIALQADIDMEAKAANDANWLSKLLRAVVNGSTPAIITPGGTPNTQLGGSADDRFLDPDERAKLESERPDDDTYGNFGHGSLENDALVDSVAAGEMPISDSDVWLTDLQRRTNLVVEEVGGQWLPDDLSDEAKRQVLDEIDAKGQWTVENIVDPSTGDRRTIVLPQEWTDKEFWLRVGEVAIEEQDPMLRVSEDYRAYRWKANPAYSLSLRDREHITKVAFTPLGSSYLPAWRKEDGSTGTAGDLWLRDGFVEPQYRESHIEDLMASMSPQQVFKFQAMAREAGFYEGSYGRFGSARFPGHVTAEDQQIIAIVMGQANVGDAHIGTTFWQVLDHWAEVGKEQKDLQTDKATGLKKAPFAVPAQLRHIPGVKTIAEETKARFEREMGRQARPDELRDMAANLTGYHETSNREQIALYLAAYNGDNQGLLTGGQLQRIEDPGAATTFDIKDKWANEIDLNKRRETNADSFSRMLNATLGGRAAIGSASAAGNVNTIGRR